MSGTIQMLAWAFALRVEPDSKLVAIYIAGVADQEGRAVLDAAKAAEWLGFVSSAQKIPQIGRLQVALQGIPNVSFDIWDDLVRIQLEVQP